MSSSNDLKPKLSLTGILVEEEGSGFTAFFAEFPEAVAEGDTEEEAQKNLFEALSNILEIKKGEGLGEQLLGGHRFIEKSFNLQVS